MKKIILSSTLLLSLYGTSLLASANAGIDQEVQSGEFVQLDGSETSAEKGGSHFKFKWEQVQGDTQVTISSKSSSTPTFVAPEVEETTVLKFKLITKEFFENRRGKTRRFRSKDFVEVVVFPKESSSTEPTIPNNPELIEHKGFNYLPVTSPNTGRTWLDRNLGANKVCSQVNDSSCFGDLYQWGREADGHQLKSSPRSFSISTTIEVGNDAFFADSGSGDFSTVDDWTRADKNGAIRSTNWSKTDGSSVCPVGYRVPTIDELNEELLVLDNGFNSFLKIPNAGKRGFFADFVGANRLFQLWSSTPVNNDFASSIAQSTGEILTINFTSRNEGHSIRCIED